MLCSFIVYFESSSPTVMPPLFLNISSNLVNGRRFGCICLHWSQDVIQVDKTIKYSSMIYRGIHHYNLVIVYWFLNEWWAWHCLAGMASKSRRLETIGSIIDLRRHIVTSVLIHLLYLIFLSIASSLQHSSIIITDIPISVWASLVKWAATGDLLKGG